MRVLYLVILVVGAGVTMRASAQTDSASVYFTCFDARADPATGKMDCELTERIDGILGHPVP